MLNDNRKIMIYEVIGKVIILSLIITCVLIIWVCINKSYPKTTINLKIPSSTIFLGWEYPIF